MANKNSIIPGTRFNRLTMVRECEHQSGRPAAIFRCDCGAEKAIRIREVTENKTQSCGCLRKQNTAKMGMTPGRMTCAYCSSEFTGTHRNKFCSIGCKLQSKIVKNPDGCWEWQGATSEFGYGKLSHAGKVHSAHRVSYELFVGEIPDGLLVCHRCDNPRCTNPKHFFLGTDVDNLADMAAKGRAPWANRKMPDEIRKKISDTKRRKSRERMNLPSNT